MNPKTNMTAIRMGRRCSHAVVRRDVGCRELDCSWVFGGVWAIGVLAPMLYKEINGWGWLGLTKRANEAFSYGTGEARQGLVRHCRLGGRLEEGKAGTIN